jgi:hypothetical protein
MIDVTANEAMVALAQRIVRDANQALAASPHTVRRPDVEFRFWAIMSVLVRTQHDMAERNSSNTQ